MQPMGQDKRHGFVRKRPHRATNMLHGVAAQVDLDLEVFMPMRAGQRRPPAFIADIEVGAVAALFHAIGGNAGAWHNGLSGGLGTTLASTLAEGETQRAHAVDAGGDPIPWLQHADARWGAGKDQVAGLERHGFRGVADHFTDRPDLIGQVADLALLTIDLEPDFAV